MKRRIWWLVGAILLGGLIAGGWWWRVKAAEHAVVTACLPPVPRLPGNSSTLVERIASATREAGSGGARAALAELSRLYHANAFYAEAASCYQGLIALAPTEPRWTYRLSGLLLADGRMEDAVALLRATIRRAPDYLPARLRLADALLKNNLRGEAEEVYAAIVQRAPSNSYALAGLARLDIAARRWTAARDKLEKAVAESNYRVGYDLLPTVYEHLGQMDRAAEVAARMKASGAYADFADPWMDELIDSDYDAYRVSIAAGAASHRGDLITAVRLLRRALELAPEKAPLHHQMALFCLEQGDLAEARAHLDRCIALAPDFADGWAYLSWFFAKAGDEPAAERTLLAGLSHCPESPGLHLDYARRLMSAGKVAEAIPYFQRSIQLRPEEAQAYVDLAQVYFGLERLADAVEVLRRGQAAEPENPEVLTRLAVMLIMAGERRDAQEWVLRAKRQIRVPQREVEFLTQAFRQRFGAEP